MRSRNPPTRFPFALRRWLLPWLTAAVAAAAAAGAPGMARAVDARSVPSGPATRAGADAAGACGTQPPAALDWATAGQRLVNCNRDFRLALRSADAARADIITAGQRPNPTLSLGGENVSPAAGIGSGGLLDKQIEYSARIDQTFERGGKRDLRVESAEQAWRAAAWTAADTLRQRQLDLGNAWIDLWGAQERLTLQQALLDLFRRSVEGAQRRLKAGDIAASDVARIQLDQQRAEAERVVVEAERSRARHALAALLAMEPRIPTLSVVDPWPLGPREDATASGSIAATETDDRPDLLAARARSANADARRRLARSQQTRDVTLGVQSERYAPPAGNGWSFGVFMSVPLFVRNNSEGEIARAEADRDVAEQTAVKLQREAYADRQRLFDARLAARQRRDNIEREALPLARRVAADAELGFRKGAGTVLDLLDALRQLRSLQVEALAARLEEDRSDVAARAQMLTPDAASDPVFGETLRWQPAPPSPTNR